MSKYFIAVVLLLGLMKGETEALEMDMFVVLKEFGVITTKYKTCSDTKDDTKRLACFDTLTQYMDERIIAIRIRSIKPAPRLDQNCNHAGKASIGSIGSPFL